MLVEFVHQGNAGRYFELQDVVVRNVVKVLDQRTQTVAVCSDDDSPALAQGGGYDLMPVGTYSIESVLEGFASRWLRQTQRTVSRHQFLVAKIIAFHEWRWCCVTPSPDAHLFVAVLLSGGLLVEALQGAVMTLVEAPGAVDGDPHQVQIVQDNSEGPDCPLQHGRVANVKDESMVSE